MKIMLDQPARAKRRRRPPAADITADTPIWCPWCQKEHPASDFNKESRRPSGLSGICRQAQAQKRQMPEEIERTVQRNKRRWANEGYRAKSLAAAAARRKAKGSDDLRRARARLQRIVDEWKGQGCVDCSYSDIRAIDPDHREDAQKVGNLSRMVQMCVAADRIRAELAKCEPRCARCHRRITQQQRQSKWRSADRLPPSWRRRLIRQDINDVIKMLNGCSDCGWAGWPRGLDWDHVRGAKLMSVASLIANSRPTSEIVAEMAKCEVVCANCHRIRTLLRSQGRSDPAGRRWWATSGR